MKVIIVGAGIMGLTTAWALVRDGHEVTIFDQAKVPNPLGASVDQQRMTRLFYGDLPGYGRKMEEAIAAYDMLWEDLGHSHYQEIGVLGLSTKEGDWVEMAERQMSAEGHDIETVDEEAIGIRCPFLKVRNLRSGVYTPRGGILLADRIMADLADALEPVIKSETRVTEIDPEMAEVTLADGTHLRADRLLVAAGAWINELVPKWNQVVAPFRQVSVYLQPPERFAEVWQKAPALVDLGGDDELYAFPPTDGANIKLGMGTYKKPGDPNQDRTVQRDEIIQIMRHFAPHFVDFKTYKVVGAKVCYYSITHDRRFRAEALGPKTWAISACSGHGFKFAAALGLRMAGTLTGEVEPKAMTSWAAGR